MPVPVVRLKIRVRLVNGSRPFLDPGLLSERQAQAAPSCRQRQAGASPRRRLLPPLPQGGETCVGVGRLRSAISADQENTEGEVSRSKVPSVSLLRTGTEE